MRNLLPSLASLVLLACGGDPETSPDASPDASTDPDAPGAGLTADLAAVRADHGVPALAAAVASPTGVLELAAVGTRHRDTTIAVETSDRWHLGSNTKAMTATLIAMAVEDGRLRWDTTLAQALPAITDMHPAYRDVSLDWLLAHRAGAWTDLLQHLDVLQNLPAGESPAQHRARFAAAMLRQPPELAPGTAFGYSNAGYMIAGAILEATYGVSWDELITTRLFTPLGMASCGFGAPGTAALVDQPWGHTGALEPVPPGEGADNPPVLGPAGTVHCSLTDWAAFGALQLGARPELVAQVSLDHMHTSLGDDYGLGWITGTAPGLGRFVAHDGSNTLWYARIIVALDADRVLLVTTNAATTGATAAVDEVTELLVARYVR